MSRLDYSTQLIEEDDIREVVKVLKSPYLTQGQKVKEFEGALCKYTGAKHAITFNSATSALFGAYSVCKIGVDDEIITSPISFVSTSNMFVTLGAKPIWCDIKKDGNIDEEAIEKLITPKTKAIIPIHFAGKVVELEKIHTLAKKYKLLVIEDAAHALGSSIFDKKIGSISDMTIFSFHAIKPITTSEGGAVLTNNDEYAKELRLIRSHGITKKKLWHSDMSSLGYNFRMTEMAAALGISQIKKLDKFILARDKIALYYNERFKNTKLFNIIKQKTDATTSHHLYPLLLNSKLHTHKESIFKELQDRGIGVQVHYKPIYKNSFYKEHFGEFTLSSADNFYKSEISIPCHQKMSIEEAKFVADTIFEVIHKYKEQKK